LCEGRGGQRVASCLGSNRCVCVCGYCVPCVAVDGKPCAVATVVAVCRMHARMHA
jgi:hypothetical protein